MKSYSALYLVILVIIIGGHLKAQESEGSSSFSDSLYQIAVSENRYIQNLDSLDCFNLPVILGSSVDATGVILMITGMEIEKDRSYFSAILRLENPMDGAVLVFEAERVPFTFSGGLEESFRLVLLNDQKLNLFKNVDISILRGSYAEADCHGFKGLGLKGRVLFSSETFIPVDENGKELTGSLESFFDVSGNNLSDLVFSISVNPFIIKGLETFIFSCESVSVDLSDLRNPEKFSLPVQNNSYSSYPSKELWKGVFIQSATVILNKEFSNTTTGKYTSFSVENIYIDEYGFSGKIITQNLVSINAGNMSGWSFSVDKLFAEFRFSKLVSGGFDGEINVPYFQNQKFLYSAIIDCAGNYSFFIHPMDSIVSNLFGESQIELSRNSFIEVKNINHVFIPTLDLTGVLYIRSGLTESSQKKDLNLNGIQFQNLRFSTEIPYVSVAYMSYSGKSQGSLIGFPVVIDKLILQCENTNINLQIGVSINLMESSSGGFSGRTEVVIENEWNGRHFSYKGFRVGTVAVHVEKPNAFILDGSITIMRNDPVYGNGFGGALSLMIEKAFQVEASAVFGKVDDLRYWAVDAKFISTQGIPAGPIIFYGGGGGLSWHMAQVLPDPSKPSSTLLKSGMKYVPDESKGLGIIMGVNIGLVRKELLKGDLKFHLQFNSKGGLQKMGFDGVATLLNPELPFDSKQIENAIHKVASKKEFEQDMQGSIQGNFSLSRNFETDEFHGSMEVMVNVAGVLTGTGPGYKAGWATVHTGPEEWYVYAGSPNQPIGLQMMGIARTSGYFMAGHNIPDAMPCNKKVMDILGLQIDDFQNSRNGSLISNGKGVAFGVNLDVTVQKETKIIYGLLTVGGGFDMMLTNYGKNTMCFGNSSSIGINGWYAKGQVYAYLSGKIGVIVKVFKKTKRLDAFCINMAAILNGEGPNPTYISGVVGGTYNLLGGLVKGKCRMEIEIGHKCSLVSTGSGEAPDAGIIGDITPSGSEDSVDPFVIPRVVFNLPVEKEIPISLDRNISGKLKVRISKCTLEGNGMNVKGSPIWNEDQDVLLFDAGILFPNTDYKFSIELSMEEWVDSKWQAVSENGAALIEHRSITFHTGELPEIIPASIVRYSYPVNRQTNLYMGESNEGYVVFSKDVSGYFQRTPSYNRSVRFVSKTSGDIYETDLVWNPSSLTASFVFPDKLKSENIYTLMFVQKPAKTEMDSDIKEYYNEEANLDSSTIMIKSRKAKSDVIQDKELIFYSASFRTSKYKTLKAKMQFDKLVVSHLYNVSMFVDLFQTSWIPDEPFDMFETTSSEGGNKLIRITALNEETPWFLNTIYPVLYKDYPLFNYARIDWRAEGDLMVPPKGTIELWQKEYDRILLDSEIETGNYSFSVPFVYMMYCLPYYWYKDYTNIRNKVVSNASTQKVYNARAEYIIKNFFWPIPDKGIYPVKVEYVLPGSGKVTSSFLIIIQNPFVANIPKSY